MYLKWGESKDFKSSIVDYSDGEICGYRSVLIEIKGDYAFGWCKSEIGIHRIVRVSKFDSQVMKFLPVGA